MVQRNPVLFTAVQWLTKNMDQILNSLKTLNISSLRMGYEVSVVSIFEKIDCIITTLYCIMRNSSFPDGTILADTDW